ncbi:MAG: PBP1A family penicillin-binding protein [Candidatus Binatia bacterium]|nr:PBP1A family penicillin-binding protein [Candidatus Binatia bacterium]
MPSKTRSRYPLTHRYRRREGHPFRLFFSIGGVLLALSAIGMGWIVYQDLTLELPSVERLSHYVTPAATRVYADDGTVIGELYLEKRYPVPLDRIPLVVQQAFIAAEDANFYRHPGIDPLAMLRALLHNWKAGHAVQGGSTITQQVVKYMLLTPEKSYRRKIQESILALRLERRLSKQEILSLYLNQIYLGSGAYGVEAAAREYFGKRVEELSLAEASLLAGLPPAPSRYSPLKNWEQAKQRQRYVLERMMEERYISYAQAMAAWQDLVALTPPPPSSYFSLAPYFVEYVRQFLEKRYGGRASYQLGLHVYTTVNLELQRAAEQALRAGIDALCQRQSCGLARPEGALLAIDLTTGQVKAMVGGYDFRQSQFNRAVQAKRQPGSAFKPLIYAAALDRGYTPATVVIDGPVSYWDHRRVWSPQNFERRYYGPTRLREALTFSRNVVTVKIASRLGLNYLTTYIPQLGIRSHLARNLSLALGTSEVTLLELARAYGVFATGGMLFEPLFITKITDSDGAVLNEFSFDPKPVIAPETAYLMTSMLQSVIERGTGKSVQEIGRPAAGKTGTTNEFQDAWFLGYTPEMLTGVWVGYDEKRSLGEKETGGRVAAPIWLDFMKRALAGRPITTFPLPAGITFSYIDPKTGLRPAPGGPAILECFRRGTEPQETTTVAALPVSPPNGSSTASDTRGTVAEAAHYTAEGF